jgi:hypothetical protein
VTDERQHPDDELTAEELERQAATPLPDREVMSTLQPPVIIQPTDLTGIQPLPPEAE